MGYRSEASMKFDRNSTTDKSEAKHHRFVEGGHQQRLLVKPPTKAHHIAYQNDFGEYQRFEHAHPIMPVTDLILRQDEAAMPGKHTEKTGEVHDHYPIVDQFGDEFLLPAGLGLM